MLVSENIIASGNIGSGFVTAITMGKVQRVEHLGSGFVAGVFTGSGIKAGVFVNSSSQLRPVVSAVSGNVLGVQWVHIGSGPLQGSVMSTAIQGHMVYAIAEGY